MIFPFRPEPDDADRLNDLLDAMRAGPHAPAPGDEAGGLALAARQFRGMADRAAGAAPVPRFDDLWEDMMATHTLRQPMTPMGRGGRIAPSHSVPSIPAMPATGMLHGVVSAAIVVLMLAGLVAAAWTLRDGTDAPGPGGDDIRLAATSLDGTPPASPDAGVDWAAWISPEECVAPEATGPVTTRIYEDEVEPAYTPIGEAKPDEAVAAAKAARREEACFVARSGRTLDEYKFVASMEETYDERASRQQEAGKAVSAEYPIDDTSEFFVFTDDRPGESGNANLVFQPRHAVALADGRILIPGTWVIWTGDPSFIQEAPENFITQAVVMERVDEQWLVAENLPVCIGDCEGMWPEISVFVSEYSAIRVAEASATVVQADTPGASPTASGDWLTWVQPEECTVEPMSQEEYAAIMREEPDISGRSYEVVGPADPAMAKAVIQTARAYEACREQHASDRQRSIETNAMIFYRTATINRSVSFDELERNRVENGIRLSSQWPTQDSELFSMVAPTMPPEDLIEPPPTPSNVDYVYEGTVFRPDQVMVLADGRVAVPESRMYWATDMELYTLEMMERTYAGHSEPPGVIILTDVSGTWLVDEVLPFCVRAECDLYWEQLLPSPGATPVATPDD